mgnify:CR=1 FL=1
MDQNSGAALLEVKKPGLMAHILVIRLSAMGDVGMTVPVLCAFTQQYPDIRITVLTRGIYKPIFAPLPNVTVYEADLKHRHKGVFGLYRLSRELKKHGITAVADLHNVVRSIVLRQFFILGGIVCAKIDKGRAEKKALTASKNKVFAQLKTTHQRYVDVFANLGYAFDLTKVVLPSKRVLTHSTRDLVGRDGKKWIGIAPFAAFEGKRYPLEMMQTVVAMLEPNATYKVFLFGGGAHEVKLLEQFSIATGAINTAGKLGFAEELALISNLDVMVSMDSGNAHLAAMYGIPTVTLWGVTHPFAGFYPFGQDINNALLADRSKFPLLPTSVYGNKMPEGYEKAIASIEPEKVYQKITEILDPR